MDQKIVDNLIDVLAMHFCKNNQSMSEHLNIKIVLFSYHLIIEKVRKLFLFFESLFILLFYIKQNLKIGNLYTS